MTKDMLQKTEKIAWFERKLNKWVKLFEDSEVESANRHNDLIGKITEVDTLNRKERLALQQKLMDIVKSYKAGGTEGGGGSGQGNDG